MKKLIPLLMVALLAGACGGDDDDDDDVDTGALAKAQCPPDSKLTYERFGKNFMDTYCNTCHSASVTGNLRQGAPTEDVFDTLDQVQAAADEIYGVAVASTAMPYGSSSKKPSADERKQLGDWLACGAK